MIVRSRLLAAGAARTMLLVGGAVFAAMPMDALAQHAMPMGGMTMPDASSGTAVQEVLAP